MLLSLDQPIACPSMNHLFFFLIFFPHRISPGLLISRGILPLRDSFDRRVRILITIRDTPSLPRTYQWLVVSCVDRSPTYLDLRQLLKHSWVSDNQGSIFE